MPLCERSIQMSVPLWITCRKPLFLRWKALLGSNMNSYWKSWKIDRACESPDSCFYVATAVRIIGKLKIDINVDPPPDLVVEIDKTNQSLHKFPIYAGFGVPEIWRYDTKRNRLQIYELRQGAYVETGHSRSFPILNRND